MSRSPFLALLVATSCAPKAPPPAPAADASPPPPYQLVETGEYPGKLPVYRYAYANGLGLVVLEDHSAPVVAYQTWYGVGSALETKGKTGLAHLFEHMMFKATEDYAEGHFDATLEKLGADGLNAWTWLDQTVYVESVPVAALRTAAELEATRMTKLKIDQAAFESEREVVVNERKLRVDNDPYGMLNEKLYAAAFQTHTYGWPTIGWMADLDALTVEDCQRFYQTWYAPNNATIVLAGDVAHADVARMIDEVYGKLPPSKIERVDPPAEPEQTEMRRVSVDVPTSADRLQVAFKTPAITSADIPALYVLDAILTAGNGGRLNRALVDTGLAGEVSSMMIGMKYPMALELAITAREGVPAEKLEERVFAELAKLAAAGPSPSDLERGINQRRSETWLESASTAGKAGELGWSLVAAGDWRRNAEIADLLGKVTAEDVQRVASAWLVPARATVGIGRATQAPAGVEAEEERSEVANTGEGPPIDARAAAAPPSLERGALVEEEIRGAQVALHYDPTSPMVSLHLGWKAGSAAEAKPGLANLTLEMLLRGTGARDRRQFEDALERLGAKVEPDVTVDHVSIDATVAAEVWPRFVALLTEALAAPRFDKDELDQLVDEVEAEIALLADDDNELADRAFWSAWYGKDHPYGRSELGTTASLPKIKVADLRKHHETWLRSGNAVVAVAGAFDSAVRDDLDKLLAAIEGAPPARKPVKPPAPPKGRRVVIVDKPARTQVAVAMGHDGPDHGSPDFPAFLLGNDVFGGTTFSARLMSKVREERGWTYFAYAYPRVREHGGVFETVLAPSTEYSVDAVQLVLDIMADTKANGITAAEFEQARDSRVRNAPFLSDTILKRAQLDFTRRLTGYDEAGYVAAMPGVTIDQAAQAIRAVYDPENMVIVLVATAADVKEKAKKLGKVEVVPFQKVE